MPKPVTNDLPDSKVTPDPKLEKRGRRDFPPDYKLRIIALADACAHGELGPLLRKEARNAVMIQITDSLHTPVHRVRHR